MLARNHTGVVLDPDEQRASGSERSVVGLGSRARIQLHHRAPEPVGFEERAQPSRP